MNTMQERLDKYPSRCGLPAQLLDRKDPVVYGRSAAELPLAQHEIAAYENEGFMIISNLFTGDEIAAMIHERERLRSARDSFDRASTIAEPGSESLRSIFRVHEVSPVFQRLACDARLVKVAEYLLGDRVYIHQSRLNYKPGFFGKEFYWHSDFETWHVEDGMPEMRALSVSISLTENTDTNGPLMLIPRSHKIYVSCAGETPDDHFRESLRKQEYGVPEPKFLEQLVEDGGIKTATGPAGTTVFFDCNTMHGSNGNITPHPRSNVFIVYNSVSNRVGAPFGPDRPRPDFLAERRNFKPVNPVSGVIGPVTRAS